MNGASGSGPREALAGAHGRWNRDVVSLFEAQVQRAPDAIALSGMDERVSYTELNRRANRLARHLVRLGVEPRSLVAICMRRSADSIVAMLAILKAGAAYVPIDPEYPNERIRFLLEDARVKLLLTRLADEPCAVPERVYRVFVDEPTLAGCDEYSFSDLSIEVAASSPAYVMYTSGTTGNPKGAVLPHSGIVRLVWQASYLPLDHTDVVLHHSTCAFDAATFEVWAALLNGGKLVLYSQPRLDLESLDAVVRAHGVTTLLLTTSVFHLVVENRVDSLGGLTNIVTGGDVMQARAAKKAIERHPHLRIINGYGPTENTTFTSCYVITREIELAESVPIGQAIGGTEIFVLDESLRPVPPGDVGELYTNGLGMAEGYLHRPELTRQRFVSSPFAAGGARMYKTGDLVRQSADGILHFVGRLDSQVKIRGFRIEPAEVEHALQLLPGVADAACLVETLESGEKQLVAYVRQSASSPAVNVTALRQQLAARVPQYMVPSRIHALDEFPLTHNGKINRQRLPLMVLCPTIALVPGGSGEECEWVVLDEWRRQLQTPSLGADDSIYDFGASSLTVMVVQSKLNERFRCAVGFVDLAQAHTPRQWSQIYQSQAVIYSLITRKSATI